MSFNCRSEALSRDHIQGGKRHRSRWAGEKESHYSHEGREHRGKQTNEGKRPHTLTVRPKSPRPAELAGCPVETDVAYTLSHGSVQIITHAVVITWCVWSSRAGWKERKQQ